MQLLLNSGADPLSLAVNDSLLDICSNSLGLRSSATSAQQNRREPAQLDAVISSGIPSISIDVDNESA
jgi:hypothetical protein